MRKIVFALAAAALAMPALAAGDPPSSTPEGQKPKKEKKICKKTPAPTGSWMSPTVCKTAAEWDQDQNSDASKLTGQARQH